MEYITQLKLSSSIQKHRTNVADGTRRIEAFGTDIHTVLDAVASENAEGIIELRQTFVRRLVATIRQEPIGL